MHDMNTLSHQMYLRQVERDAIASRQGSRPGSGATIFRFDGLVASLAVLLIVAIPLLVA